MSKPLKAIVLAAGKGTRIGSQNDALPKVMRKANGYPLLAHVLRNISFIDKSDIIIVVGFMRELIVNSFTEYNFAVQKEQLGTGHAVASAADSLRGFTGDVLICYGDMPLLDRNSYRVLIDSHRNSGYACTVLTGVQEENLDYGRIIRNPNGTLARIVEAKDAAPEELSIREYNSGVYVFDAPLLLTALNDLKNDNAQAEYYLTDVPSILQDMGESCGICSLRLAEQMQGVNTAEDLALTDNLLRRYKGEQ